MARRRVTIDECDRCGAEVGEENIYTITFSDGVKQFMLCDKHNNPLLKLYEAEYGDWRPHGKTRRRTASKIDL